MSEDGEFSDDGTNLSPVSESFDESLANNIMKMASDTKSEHVRKKKRKSKYSLLEASSIDWRD
ncbi:hypothetical protein DPMN_083748 [Dreissena polymorpha]|uniref:Uncharacterized protein n=1 Tax=Dreissena polymorpha TaxID=45954 RepID=A0A9D3Y9C6_DREPO|nr:hypothetical protein DPMN_083748 [Dreissena polymorpha]